MEKAEKLIALPLSYSEVTPISFFKQQPESKDYSEVQDSTDIDMIDDSEIR